MFIFVLLLVCVVQAFASDILSQKPGLKLANEETSLQLVLDEIEKQTDLRFLYHNETVVNKTIKIDVQNKSWYEILDQIKEASDVNYRILEDNLVNYVFQIFSRNLFREHPYRFHILGSQESVSRLKRADIISLHKKLVHPKNLCISLVSSRVLCQGIP